MTEIQLSDRDMDFIEGQIKAGTYKDASAVIEAGLRLLGSSEGKLAELQRQIQEGLNDVEAGRVMQFKDAAELTAHILAMAEDGKNAVASSGDVSKVAGRSVRNL